MPPGETATAAPAAEPSEYSPLANATERQQLNCLLLRMLNKTSAWAPLSNDNYFEQAMGPGGWTHVKSLFSIEPNDPEIIGVSLANIEGLSSVGFCMTTGKIRLDNSVTYKIIVSARIHGTRIRRPVEDAKVTFDLDISTAAHDLKGIVFVWDNLSWDRILLLIKTQANLQYTVNGENRSVQEASFRMESEPAVNMTSWDADFKYDEERDFIQISYHLKGH